MLKKTLWTVLTAVCAVLLTVFCVGSPIADYYAAAINSYFNCKTFELVEDDFTDFEDKTYYKYKFAKTDGTADKEALYAYDKQIAKNANNEGSVLLWNNGNALPLTDKSKTINFYGGRSYNYAFVTDGSGGVRMSETPRLKAAFEQKGYTVNNELWNFYSGRSYGGGTGAINETPWSNEINTLTSSGYGLYVISRKGSEGCDLYMTGSDGENGNLTALSEAEKNHLENLVAMKKSGKLSKIILILNTVSMGVQFDKISAYRSDIDACLWVGLGGTSGPDSVADLVSGEVSPSGKLSDTFVYNSFSAPSTENSGNYDYAGASEFASNAVYKKLLSRQGNTDSTEKNLKYIAYAEGIYVGYKYYETRYEDTVLNQGNASSSAGVENGKGNWNYDDEVAFPFGYGLSYTTFAFSDFKVSETAKTYEVSVNVKNTGAKHSGKEVVQVYLQKPYTEYDKDNGIEQASVNLVGFNKTKILAPGESDTVKVSIEKTELKTYDANGVKSYITDGGKYYLTVAENAHAAVNNILAKKGYSVDGANAEFVKEYDVKEDLSVTKSQYTDEEITNKFDDADVNKAELGIGKVTYLSRSDWQGTYPKKVTLNLTEKLLEGLDYGKSWTEDEFDEVPAYEQKNGLTLFSLWKDTDGKELPYDHALWDTLLDETSFTEQAYLICNAWCATQSLESVAAPGTENRDGPAGLNYLPDGKVIGLGMCYPSENIIASAFNTEIAYEIGVCLGEDNLACGFTFIYAPGANIHRSAFGGRNGEYYSEDAVLSGLMCEAEVKGIQSNGGGAQAKHYALNDQEVNRNGVSVWANEQAIREIYLKAFEFASAKGRGEMLSVMSSFNRVGTLWSGAHKGLMTDVLRGEWGFVGFVQSDGNGYALMANYVDGIRAGNDLFMCGGGKKALDKYKDSPAITLAVRESTHRVLYVLTKTNAMNGLSASTRIVTLTPWWRTTITALIISFAVLTAASATMLVLSFVFGKNKKIKTEVENDEN